MDLVILQAYFYRTKNEQVSNFFSILEVMTKRVRVTNSLLPEATFAPQKTQKSK